MVRDPADVAVSQYFQWKFRMTNRKKKINNYPEDVDDVSLYDFVMMPACGLPKIIDFMNGWARELGNIKDLMVIRYEDLRADPQDMLRRVLDFIGTPATSEELRQAVEFASIENMRMLEQKRVFWLSGRRMLGEGPVESQHLQGSAGEGRRLPRRLHAGAVELDRRDGGGAAAAGLRL